MKQGLIAEVTTGQLHLSPVSMEDLEAIHVLHTFPETDRYNTMGIPGTVEETRQLIAGWLTLTNASPPQKYVFRVQNSTDDFIGVVGINSGKPRYRNAEIWYKLHPDHWNKGYATAIVKALLHFCFTELDLHRVEAGCVTQNTASIHVLEKNGFLKEGTCRKKLPIRGEWVDNYEFAILEEDYRLRKDV